MGINNYYSTLRELFKVEKMKYVSMGCLTLETAVENKSL